jgi:two-component sensor histidine kinase
METKKPIQIIIHLLIWIIIIAIPFIFLTNNNIIDFKGSFLYLSSFLGSIIVFYTNYLFLVDKLLFNKKTFQFLFANITLIVVSFYLSHALRHFFDFRPPLPPAIEKNNQDFFLIYGFMRESITLIAIAGLSVAIKATTYWYISDNEKKELEKIQLESELKNLKSQLNPHFLFNTLNNIYSLTITDKEKAQIAIQELSGLLRYVLYESNQHKVTLKKDLDFVISFINLMTLRLNNNVQLTVEMPTDVKEELNIAPLLFISLIENAFKHGLKSMQESYISIKIKIIENDITCSVLNSNFPTSNPNEIGSGIGLGNLKKRLKILYPISSELVTENRGDTYYALLKIKLK